MRAAGVLLACAPFAGLVHGAGAETGGTPGLSLAARILLTGDANAGDAGNAVMIDPGARRLLYWGVNAPVIRAYDLDTFTQVAAVPRDPAEIAGLPWALDGVRHVLYHVGPSKVSIRGVDTRTLRTVVSVTLPSSMSDGGQGYLWSERDQLLYVVDISGGTVNVAAFDPWSGANGTLRWTSSVNQCATTLSQNNPAALGETRDGRYLVFLCELQPGPGGASAVVRMEVPPPGATLLPGNTWRGPVDIVPGLVTGGFGDDLWVPQTDRMVIEVASNGQRGWSAYVFDADSDHFVAAPGLYTPPSDGNVWFTTPPSYAVDPATGRLFTQASALTEQPQAGGLCKYRTPGSNSLALTETGVGGAVRHFAVADDAVNGNGRVAGYDPVRRNWWMFSDDTPPVSGCNPFGVNRAAYLVAWHDSLPAAVAPPAPDVDAGTAAVAEQPGVTGANATSDAAAYGVRYVVGPSGTEGVAATATVLAPGTCNLDAYVAQNGAAVGSPLVLHAPPAPPQYHAYCNADGRTATFAHIAPLRLDASEARAVAVTGDTDRETARDLATGTDASQPGPYLDSVSGFVGLSGALPAGAPCQPLASCGEPAAVQPYLSGLALPYAPAACEDSGGEATQDQRHADLPPGGLAPSGAVTYPGAASVECSMLQQLASAHADQASTSLGGPLSDPVSAATATADATVSRTALAGSVAIATVTVKDIRIGSVLHIASLTATATAQAHGRAGTNRPSYTCVVSGVTAVLPPAVSLPQGVASTIPSASCSDPKDSGYRQLQALLDQVNALFVGHLHIDLPRAYTAADAPPGGAAGVVQRQSPRGYLSEVALSDLDQVQNAILLDDTDIEQPALTVTYFLDNANSRNRLVASFAGVATAARYGIFLLDDSGAAGDAPPDGEGADAGIAPPAPGPAATSAGLPPLPAPAATPPVAPPARSALWSAIPGAIVDGLRLLAQHPELIPPLLAVWLLFAGPGYVLARRRALLRAVDSG